MKSRTDVGHLRYLAWLSVLFLLFVPLGTATAEVLEVGAHTVDVTPPIGIPMWGYGNRHDDLSTGVMDPLQANALVLAVGENKLAIVGLDIGRAPTRQSMAKIRQVIK